MKKKEYKKKNETLLYKAIISALSEMLILTSVRGSLRKQMQREKGCFYRFEVQTWNNMRK